MIHVFAQDAAAPSTLATFLPWVVLAAAFYFLFIRPQQTRNRRQQELMRSLEIGDKVRTAGGIFGVIVSIDETEVVLGVEEGRLRVARAAVQTRIEPEVPDDAAEGSES